MSWVTASYIKYPEYKRKPRLPKEQLEAMVTRLNVAKKTLDSEGNAMNSREKHLTQKKVNEMLERLADTEKNKDKTPESQRTGAAKVMGIVNTYAWRDARIVKSRVTRADGNWH